MVFSPNPNPCSESSNVTVTRNKVNSPFVEHAASDHKLERNAKPVENWKIGGKLETCVPRIYSECRRKILIHQRHALAAI